jgi:DDE superfamily endonuclease
MAAHHPDMALGFEDDGGWRRAAQPQRHAWSDDKPVRLVEKTVPAKDPEGKAVACYGLYVPTASQILWRVVRGRPVSGVTCAFLAWLATYFTAQGQRALVLIWDNASWHVSQAVQAWIKTHHRHAIQEGGCRLIVYRLPSKSPWLNPIEPKWVHGKRAVVEPARVLATAELIQRVCAYYQCELTDPIAQPDC